MSEFKAAPFTRDELVGLVAALEHVARKDPSNLVASIAAHLTATILKQQDEIEALRAQLEAITGAGKGGGNG